MKFDTLPTLSIEGWLRSGPPESIDTLGFAAVQHGRNDLPAVQHLVEAIRRSGVRLVGKQRDSFERLLRKIISGVIATTADVAREAKEILAPTR